MLRTSLKHHADRNGLCVSEPNQSLRNCEIWIACIWQYCPLFKIVCHHRRFACAEGRLAWKLQLDHIITSTVEVDPVNSSIWGCWRINTSYWFHAQKSTCYCVIELHNVSYRYIMLQKCMVVIYTCLCVCVCVVYLWGELGELEPVGANYMKILQIIFVEIVWSIYYNSWTCLNWVQPFNNPPSMCDSSWLVNQGLVIKTHSHNARLCLIIEINFY